jgi:hypothetical protein
MMFKALKLDYRTQIASGQLRVPSDKKLNFVPFFRVQCFKRDDRHERDLDLWNISPELPIRLGVSMRLLHAQAKNYGGRDILAATKHMKTASTTQRKTAVLVDI